MVAHSAIERVDVAILGAGISGVLAAQQAIRDNLSFRILDRCQDFGGVWDFRANSYSHLQVGRHDGLKNFTPTPTQSRLNLTLASRLTLQLTSGKQSMRWPAVHSEKYRVGRS